MTKMNWGKRFDSPAFADGIPHYTGPGRPPWAFGKGSSTNNSVRDQQAKSSSRRGITISLPKLKCLEAPSTPTSAEERVA